MVLIVSFQLILMALLPIAIYRLLFLKKPRPLIVLILILLSFPGYALCMRLWPVDFIFQSETRFGHDIGDYRVEIVQKPGFDYYDTFFEVTHSHTQAIFLIDSDDRKWWFPRVVQENDKIYFLRIKEKPNTHSSYISIKDTSLFIQGRFYSKLSKL